MVFNSSIFAVFLILVFFLYWFIFNKKIRLQNFFIIMASYVFYGWWDWRFLFLLFFTSFIDYAVGYYLGKRENTKTRKRLLAISLISNLGVLGIFKYYDFFVQSFTQAFQLTGSSAALHIILPVGISFYTFQSLSYTIDVYRKNVEPCKDVITFLAFISFFPQLVAGPIERAKHMLPQFMHKREFSYEEAITGLRQMLWGFFKKIVIADNAALFVNQVFNAPDNYHGFNIIIASFFFAIQIYCDFSGYSDIAIGTARLFGFELRKNFNAPYFSASPKEFWHRWHMSLSTWFRDYVYIPLGGSRKGDWNTIKNLMISFLVSGLWHGANFTFIIWGFLHGAAVSLQTFFEQKGWRIRIYKGLAILLTFLFTSFAWIFFRAENLHDAGTLIAGIFHNYGPHEMNILSEFPSAWNGLSLSLVLFILLEVCIQQLRIRTTFFKIPIAARCALYYVMIIWILFYGALNAPPSFIYFQF